MEEVKHERIDYEKLMHKNHNRGTMVTIIVVLLGYLFFFLSPLLFHEKPDKTLSALDSEIPFATGRIVINQWLYSPDQNMMEICCTGDSITLSNLAVDASCNYTYKTKGTVGLSSEVGFVLSDYIVIYVYDVPDDWYCVSVRGSIDLAEKPTVESSTAGVAETTKNGSSDINYGIIYTCVDDVENVDYINNEKTKSGYIIERNTKRIEYNENKIAENENAIAAFKADIQSKNDEITALNRDKSFQIEKERIESDYKISTLNKEIKTIETQIKNLQTDIVNLKDEISDYERVIAQLS